jgi:large subunit ribosomal protein L25
MPDTYAIELRSITGKAVKALRRDGTIPGNIYGRGLESVAVQLPWARAREMLNAHGRNTLIEVQVDSSAPRPVVVRDIARNPVSGEVQHIDFFQVDLTRTIQADVPIHFVGEAPAVPTYGGVFVQSLDVVHVEALPNEMPDAIEVSIASLKELEQSLAVYDIVARPRLESEESVVPEGEEGAVPEGEESASDDDSSGDDD